MNKRYVLMILVAMSVLFASGGLALLDLPGTTPVAAHPNGDEEPAEEEPAEEEPTAVPSGASSWDDFPDSLDVAIQGITGGFSPKVVAQSVDIVVEASRGIKARNEFVDAYTQQYGSLYGRPPTPPTPPQPTISQRFWRWAAGIVFFLD